MNKDIKIEEITLDLNHIIHFKDNGLVARYATAEAMHELGYHKQSEWISVEDRLPELFADVLVLRNGKIEIDYNEEDGYFAYDFKGKRVTHWMPLPSPPTEKEN